MSDEPMSDELPVKRLPATSVVAWQWQDSAGRVIAQSEPVTIPPAEHRDPQ